MTFLNELPRAPPSSHREYQVDCQFHARKRQAYRHPQKLLRLYFWLLVHQCSILSSFNLCPLQINKGKSPPALWSFKELRMMVTMVSTARCCFWMEDLFDKFFCNFSVLALSISFLWITTKSVLSFVVYAFSLFLNIRSNKTSHTKILHRSTHQK